MGRIQFFVQCLSVKLQALMYSNPAGEWKSVGRFSNNLASISGSLPSKIRGKHCFSLAVYDGLEFAKEVRTLNDPMQLNPNASEAGVNKRQYYKQKFGARSEGIVSGMTVRFVCPINR